MDCGHLNCCKMANREKDYCFSDCLLGHLESFCSDEEKCNDADGLFCCNGKCQWNTEPCLNLGRGDGEECFESTNYVTWDVCAEGTTCTDNICLGPRPTDEEIAEKLAEKKR